MRPEPGQVLHFSEDPTSPVRAARRATAQQPEAYVWAVDHARSPDYWFPRRCPRAMAWPARTTTAGPRPDHRRRCGDRVHAIEYGWLEAMRTARLYAYRLPAERFRPFGDAGARARRGRAGRAARPARTGGDLLRCHAEAGIQLRVLDNLWPFWDEVRASTVGSAASACATPCRADSAGGWHVSGI